MKILFFNIVLLSLHPVVFPQAEQKFLRRGNNEYKDGKFKEAEINYLKALEENPESVKANFNLGNSIYRQENYGSAAERYGDLVEKAENNTEASKYYYNRGNSLFKSGKYKESAEAYKNSLLNDPDDMDAKHNLQMALRMLNQQEQQQNQNENQGNQQQPQQQKEDQQQPQAQQNNPGQDENQADQPRQGPGKISKEDAERILQALENDEKEVLKRVQDQKAQRQEIPVEKNW